MDLTNLKTYRDALELENSNKMYEFKSIFTEEGLFGKSVCKKKFALMKNFHCVLQRFLEDDEKIYYITMGVEASIFEQLFSGWLYNRLNRRALFFTSKRIILLQYKGKYKPWGIKNQILYSNIKSAKKRLFGLFQVDFTNSDSLILANIPKYDRNNFIKIYNGIRSKFGDLNNETTGAVDYLCPFCNKKIIYNHNLKDCPECEARLKSTKKAVLFSLVFPGFGNIYLGNHLFGAFEVFIAVIVWLSIVVPLFDIILVPGALGALLITVLLTIATFHGFNSWITYKNVKKGIYPI